MSTQSPTDLVATSIALMRSERDLQERLDEAMKRAGLPPPDWYLVLEDIVANPEGWQRQTSLQKSTRLAQYSICRLVDRLQREGLVERRTCPVDGRNNVVLVTAAGRDLHARMRPVYEEAIGAHFGGLLTLAETRHLKDLLAKLQRD